MARLSAAVSRASGAVARVLVGTLIGQGTILLISPLLTRMYSASDFGVLALVTSIAAVIGSFASLSFESAVPLARSDEDAGALVLLGLVSVVTFSVIVGATSFLLRGRLADWFDAFALAQVWWLIPFTSFGIGIYNVLSSWLVRHRQFGRLGVRNATQGLVQAVWATVLGVVDARTGIGLTSSLGVGRSAGALIAASGAMRAMLLVVRSQGLRAAATVTQRFRRFPLVLSWSRLINGLGLQAPMLLLGWWYGAAELGLFALTMRVLAAPVGMLSDAVAQYFEGTFAKRLKHGEGLRTMVVGIALGMAAIAVVPVIVILLVGPSLFSMVFGGEWSRAGELARYVVLMFMFQLAASPISRALPLLQRQGTQVIWDTSRLLLVAIAILVPVALSAPLETTLVWMASAQIVSYIAVMFLVLLAVRDRERQMNVD